MNEHWESARAYDRPLFPKVDAVKLEKMRCCCRAYFDELQLTEMPFSELRLLLERTIDALVLSLRGDVLSQTLQEIRYPANWYEAFRERWLPVWWLKRHPVHYTTVTFHALYPKIAMPDQPYVVVHRSRSEQDVPAARSGSVD